MDALMFFRELNRMCRFYKGCDGCPFCDEECCPTIIGEKADEIVQFVERWSKDHPQKTRLQDFWEKYPNANLDEHGFPDFCCAKLGYVCNCGETTCEECWNMPVEE